MHVGGFLGDALVGLLARRSDHLLGLLLHLRADASSGSSSNVAVYEPCGRVAARSAIVRSSDREHLVRRPRVQLAAVKAGPLTGVARRAGRLDQREQRVGVAVVADRLDRAACSRRSRPCARARWRERLKKWTSPRLARQRAATRRSCTRASAPRRVRQSWTMHGTRPCSSNAMSESCTGWGILGSPTLRARQAASSRYEIPTSGSAASGVNVSSTATAVAFGRR